MARRIAQGLAALALVAVASSAAPAAEGAKGYTGYGASSVPLGALRAGDQVPMFKHRDISGREIDLAALLAQKRKVLLAFWSMYCQACVEKFNAMIAVQTKYGPLGLQVVSVNTDGEYRKGEGEIRAFLAAYEAKHRAKVNFPVIYDETNALPQALRIEFLPTLVTVDPKGRVCSIYRKFDEPDEEAIYAGIEAMVHQYVSACGIDAPPGR